MLKNLSNKDKFTTYLTPWVPYIIEAVKKDLRNEHLKKDYSFVKKYFDGKAPNRLTNAELAEGYNRAMLVDESAETLAEYIYNRWLLQNSEVYSYFEDRLKEINQNFSEIEEIDLQRSHIIMEGAITQFGAVKTYLFSVINSVVFPKEIYDKLLQHAKEESVRQEEEDQVNQQQASLDQLKLSFEQQMARMADKYEKKLLGLQKKYHTDTEMLKKQVATLQRKLNGN